MSSTKPTLDELFRKGSPDFFTDISLHNFNGDYLGFTITVKTGSGKYYINKSNIPTVDALIDSLQMTMLECEHEQSKKKTKVKEEKPKPIKQEQIDVSDFL